MPAPLTLSRRRAQILRTAFFGVAAALGLSSALGWRLQRPWADPAHPPQGLARFFTPSETNAWMRLGARGSGFPVGPAYWPREVPRRSPIEDLKVAGQHVFVAFNDGTIVRGSARDDGVWRQARLDVPRSPGPLSLALPGDLEGYAVAGTGALFRTADGGESWERVRTAEPLPPLLAIDAYGTSAPALWVLAEGEALWSGDGGRTWTRFALEEAGPEISRPELPEVVQAFDRPPGRKHGRGVEQASWPGAPSGPSRAAVRVRPPPGPYQVCATPGETWLITPRGAFTIVSEGERMILRRAEVGADLVRCVRHRRDVVGLIDAADGAWRRASREEPWRRSGDPRVSDMFFPDGDANGFAVGPAGYARSPGEDGREAAAFPWRRDLRRISGAGSPPETWVLDADDSLWHASARGGPWRRTIAFRSSVTAAAEPQPGVMLAATSTGMVLRSENHGVNWIVAGTFDRPIAALATTSTGQWAAVAPGWPLQGWLEPAAPGQPWVEVSLADGVLRTPHPDGSLTYPPIDDLEAELAASRLPGVADVTALYVPPEGDGVVWGVGRGGRIVRAAARGEPVELEQRPSSDRGADLHDVAVVGSQGWAVGDHGTVLRSSDGGRTWARVAAPTGAALSSVLVLDRGTRVAVFGEGDAIQVTDDGGRTWRSPVNRLYPAPWCLVLCALALGLGVAGALVKVPAEVVSAHVEDLLASDAPILDERQDLLGQAQLARTITYFLQNDRTEAPLTLAITGEWGSGKSSVLNLVRKGLSRAGMPVIRFNAWHHQQDADLLASLFSCIVKGAGPHGLARVEFRMRLMSRRWRTRAWMVAALALLATFLLGLYMRAPQYARDAFAQVTPLLQCAIGMDCPDPPAISSERSRHASTFWGGGLATLLVVAPMLTSLLRSLRSFGVNPAALVSAVSGGLRGRVPTDQVAFRARFADEFDDVTHALGRRRLVLMIDDLDRCSPDNLLKVLEAMDFLVSSGRCFVVLAMSRPVVLKNLAFQLAPPPVDRGLADAEADRYLQKLINVEVALRPLTPAAGRSLLVRAEVPPGDAAEISVFSRASRWVLLAGMALGVGVLAYQGGVWLGAAAGPKAAHAQAEAPPEPMQVVAASPPAPASTAAAHRSGVQPPPRPHATAVPTPLPERWSIRPAAPPERSPWAILPWLFLVAGGLLVLAVTSSPRPMTTDSRDFHEALERWSDVIQLQHDTPRALKRFLNRLRFWAMRLRAEREPAAPVSPWQRLLSRQPGPRGRADPMSEPALVALATLHEIRPELVLHADHFARALQAAPAGDADQGILRALAAERERTGSPTEEDRRRFQELLGGLQMRT